MGKAADATIKTQPELAAACGVKWGTFRDWMQDPDWPLPKLGPWPVWCVRVVQVWSKFRFPLDEDPLISGSNPDIDEAKLKYITEKGRLAELDRKEREGELMPRSDVRSIFTRIAMALRGAGEVLQRQFGAEAHRVVDDALADAERTFEGAIGK